MNLIFNGSFGFDISTYQDAAGTLKVVDFQKMKDYGASFVIIRVGQGNFIDADWSTHRNNSRGILPRGVYWFYDPKFDAVAQAELCLSALGDEQFARVYLDLEFWWDGGYSSPAHWRKFLDTVKGHGYRTGIYTAYSWWIEHAIGRADMGYFGKEALWMAQYNIVPDLVPPGFVNPPLIWQNAILPIGEAAGVESKEIDHDLWNMFYDFAAEWGTSPTPPADGDEPMKVGTVVATVLNIRSGPGTGYKDLGDLHKGDRVYGEIDPVTNWIHFSRIVRVNGTEENFDGWASATSTTFMTIADYVPPAATTATLNIEITDPKTGIKYGADNIQLPQK